MTRKGHTSIPTSWPSNWMSLSEDSGTFWFRSLHFPKEGPFFTSGTAHAGCNGNLGSLRWVRDAQFSFAEPGERGSRSMSLGGRPHLLTSLANQRVRDGLGDGHMTQAGPMGNWLTPALPGCWRCDLLAAALLPRRTSLPVNDNKSERNKAQK